MDRSTVEVPDHVVFREFAQETVLLNLDSGQYYGLNPTAGKMFGTLRDTATLAQALESLREVFPNAGQALEGDMAELCGALQERGLIRIVPA